MSKFLKYLAEGITDYKKYFDMFDWRDAYRDLYPKYSKPQFINKSETDYKFNSEKEAKEYVDQILDTLTFPNTFTVYRAVYLKKIEDLDTDDLGESWSFEKDSAIEFGGHGGCNYLLVADISNQDVDYDESFKRYIEFSDMFSHESENEVVVKYGTDFKNLKVIPWKDINKDL